MIPFLLGSVAIAPPVQGCQQQARAQGFVVLQTQVADRLALKTWRRGQSQILLCTANPDGTVNLSHLETPFPNRRWQLHGDGEPPITLEFRDGRIGGSGGCNFYSSRYTLSPTAFAVQEILATKRACTPSVMERETRFFSALRQAQHLQVQGNDLRIETSNPSEPLRFHAQQP
ncbi:MAG: META domain-containing protein [Oscillatoriales cyanobacterium SM2_1_8]|nr:META domain-containing protein [Oscillatoriales cyanobacterium SM2_1_8]